MMLRFSVSNHLSIRDSQELLFPASSLKDQTYGLIECRAVPSGFVVPTVVLYGANASGKSNMVDAFTTMRTMVLHSHIRGEPNGGVPRRPFRLDPASFQTRSHFEIDFVFDDVHHRYGFEAGDESFESEWLYAFPKSYRRTLFERKGSEYRFGRWLKGRNDTIAALTRSNSLYVSAAAQNGHEYLSMVYEYFRSMRIVRNISVPGSMVSARLAAEEPDPRVIDFLEKLNTGVVGYRKNETVLSDVERTLKREITAITRKFSEDEIIVEGNLDRDIAIELAHRDCDGKTVYFELDQESAGTRRLLVLLAQVFRTLDDGVPLFIDELDASLHTHACKSVLDLFGSPETNPKGAQVVATSHDTNLMSLPNLRRDQLWFIEKDSSGATRLYPLTDYKVRKGDNVGRWYLEGRYGATPIPAFHGLGLQSGVDLTDNAALEALMKAKT